MSAPTGIHQRPSPSGGLPSSAVAGAFTSILFLVGFGLLAKLPSPDASGAEVVRYLADHRDRIFIAACLIGVAAALFTSFMGALAAYLRSETGNEQALPAVLAGLAGVILVVLALALLAGLVVHLGHADERQVALAFDVYNSLITIAGFFFAAFVGAAAIAGVKAGRLSARYLQTGCVVALLQLATVPGLWVTRGVLAAGGLMAIVAFSALSLWFIAVALRMARESRRGATG